MDLTPTNVLLGMMAAVSLLNHHRRESGLIARQLYSTLARAAKYSPVRAE